MKKIIFVNIIGLFALGVVSFSFAMDMCGLGDSGKDHSGCIYSQGSDGNIGNKTCSVSGEAIDEKSKAEYEFEGRTYNFCCPMCVDEFKKDPHKYIKKIDSGQKEKSESEHSVPPQDLHHHNH